MVFRGVLLDPATPAPNHRTNRANLPVRQTFQESISREGDGQRGIDSNENNSEPNRRELRAGPCRDQRG
jgi:hypothetical protein